MDTKRMNGKKCIWKNGKNVYETNEKNVYETNKDEEIRGEKNVDK